jgi:hypothetical protein
MDRQALPFPDGVFDRVCAGGELGTDEDKREEEMAQRIHERDSSFYSTWTRRPFRYSPSGKLSATG